jgi:hypothetical protein
MPTVRVNDIDMYCHQTRRVNADGLASPCESVDCIQPLFNGTRYDG